MKIIYDNIIFSLQKSGGISVYWSELCARLSKLQNATATFFEQFNSNEVRKTIALRIQKESNILPPQILRALPFTKRISTPHIFHSSYYRYSPFKKSVNIVTVHDFTHEKFGSGPKNKLLIWQKRQAIKHADGIICQSENTKKDLLECIPEASNKDIVVIYPGVSSEYQSPVERQDQMVVPYLLFVGSRAHYKNFEPAVRALAKLPNYKLIIVGGGDLSPNESRLLEGLIPKRYKKLKFVTNKELNILYRKAHALLYPSLYEGFGIPVAEALVAGCPVITTRSSSLIEASGGNAILLDIPTSNNIMQAIAELESTQKREELVRQGLNYSKQFSWDNCFQKTLDFYSEILSSHDK